MKPQLVIGILSLLALIALTLSGQTPLHIMPTHDSYFTGVYVAYHHTGFVVGHAVKSGFLIEPSILD